MKKHLLAFAFVAGLAHAPAVAQQVITVSGNITSNTTWSNQNIYRLQGFVYVQDGVTLTIQPGALIKGDKDTKGTLIIERGAKLIADGTALQPIVFTSDKPAGQRTPGDWGGLIILGKAPVNLPGTPLIEGGVDRPYGGNVPTDNSGTLRYVRVEYPGIAFTPGNEINGITFGGVGSGTTVEHVMVAHSGDDAFEWFGGTMSAKYLVAYKTVDDMFDTDNGFNGTIQYAIGLSDPNVADASKSNGFESDNDAAGSASTPLTAPKFINVSLFGPKATSSTTSSSDFGRGMHIRRNSHLEMHNSVVAGWPVGLLLDGAGTQGGAMVKQTVIAGSTNNALAVENGSSFNVSNWFNTTMTGNTIMADNADLMVPNAFNQTAPNFMPAAGSPLLSGGQPVAGAEANNFRGAIGTTDWTAGWTNWNPQTTPYNAPLGLNSNTPVSTANLFPNPTTGVTRVTLAEAVTGEATIAVFDLTGKQFAVPFRATENADTYAAELSCNNLPAGVYLVKVTTKAKLFTARLVVAK